MKRIYIAVISGIALSGLGMLAAFLGEWGRCGSSPDLLATIGLYLNLYHVLFYSHLFGSLYTDSEVINIVLIFIISSIDWIVISYLLLLAITFIKKKLKSKKKIL